ncbi:MAG TPA: phosphodiester glycosidase family protein [Clostridiaceae bacterium]
MKKKKKHLYRKFLSFLLYILFVIIITMPFVVFYGPYNNVKKVAVSMIMGTRHKYLATTFLSQKQIDNIIGDSQNATGSQQAVGDVTIANKNSSEVSRFDLTLSYCSGYLLEIKNPTKVKVALTKNLGKEGQKTSEMAKEKNAIAAINGGSFQDASADGMKFAGTGALPGGFVISGGEVVYKVPNEKTTTKETVTAFTKDGTLIIGSHSISDLIKLNVAEAICFRPPALIVNGVAQIKDKLSGGTDPRSAIGQKKDGTVVFLVTNGRNLLKPGATYYDLQEIFLSHGVVNATILDGGYSSTMYYKGKVINNPSEWDGERSVATALYVLP